MSVKDVLQGFRNKASVRTLDLTPEEAALVPEQEGEVCLSVYGTFIEGKFKVSRVTAESEEGDTEGPPNRAMPSPS